MRITDAYWRFVANVFRRTRRHEQPMEEADAIILDFHLTGSVRNGMIEASVLLQVMPQNERNYVVEHYQYFAQAQVQELDSGAKRKILFSRSDPSKIRWITNAKNGT